MRVAKNIILCVALATCCGPLASAQQLTYARVTSLQDAIVSDHFTISASYFFNQPVEKVIIKPGISCFSTI